MADARGRAKRLDNMSRADLIHEVRRLRARVRSAGEEKCRKLAQELEVYREEARQQQEQLLEAQAALEESRDRYAALYEYAPVGYLTLDYNGVIEQMNLIAAELLGVERTRGLSSPLLTFIAGGDRKAFLRHLLNCRRERTIVSVELRIHPRHRRDAVTPVLLQTWATSSRYDELGGRGYEFRTAMLDLTDRERAREQEVIYRERLRSLASELSLAEERERRRLAVAVHDHVSQALAMAKMRLDGALRHPSADGIKPALAEVSRLVEEVLVRTRTLTFDLSPPVLYELGFEPALEWLAERAGEQHGLKVAVDLPREPVKLPTDLAVMLFQAARELLVNVWKHAAASHAALRLRRAGGRVQLVVEDDGKGIDTRRLAAAAERDGRSGGFGLFSIRARLEHLGGGLDVEDLRSQGHGKGARLTLTVPVENDPAAAGGAQIPARAEKPEAEIASLSHRNPNNLRQIHTKGPGHESPARRRPPHRKGRPA